MSRGLPTRTATDYAQIAFSGGGLTLDAAHWTTTQLAQIAYSAANKHARIVITSARLKTTAELCQIAFSGQGCVSFVE